MNAKDFEKYAGKKTVGNVGNYSLEGGIIVGYDYMSQVLPLLAKVEGGNKYPPYVNHIKFATEKDKEDLDSGEYTYRWCSTGNVIMDEPNVIIDKPLDLTKILEGCEGVTLWSNVLGKCKLEKIYVGAPYPIVVSITDKYESFTKEGLYNDRYESAECTLFPSETNRDWSTFKKPVKVKDDDWVVCCDRFNTGGCILRYKEVQMNWRYIIPFEKFKVGLTEEELKKLSII